MFCKLFKSHNQNSEGLLSWTTIVVHSRDVEDCGSAPRRKSTLKPAKIPYITMWQYWLGNTESKKAFRLILNTFKKLLQNFLKNLFNRIFWLTACLMPSDSRNSTMAKATALMFLLLLDVASAREVPFAIPLCIQCVLHGLSTALLCVPFIFVHHEKCRYSGRHVMAFIK